MSEEYRVGIKTLVGVALAIFGLLLLMFSVNIVADGQVGVKKTLGDYKDEELDTGLKFHWPIISSIEKVNVKKLNIKEKVSVPSKEGLLVNLDVSLIYRIKPNKASEIKQTVSGTIEDTLVKAYMRNGIRDIASGYEAKAMYSEIGRREIADKLQLYLEENLKEGVIVVDVLLRDVKLPDKVIDSIERKINAEQKAQAKEFELQAAIKDAEIEIARANGTAEANRIIGDSISKEYIQYKFIEGLNDGNTEVIYVPTEGNIPVMEASRFQMNKVFKNNKTDNKS